MHEFDLKRVDTGALTLSCRDEGRGTPVVLIHGMGGGSAAWGGQIAALRNRYRVIAWDAPGYGESDPFADEHPKIADYVDVLVRFLDACDVDTAHLAGHSIGACHIVSFQRRFPDRVRSLALIQPFPGRGMANEQERQAAYQGRVEETARMSRAEFARHRAVSAMAPGVSEELIGIAAALSYSAPPEGQLRQWAALCEANIFEEFGDIDVPVMLAAGEFDRTANVAMCEAMASDIPGASVRLIEGAGHVAYLEAADRLNEILADFLGRLG